MTSGDSSPAVHLGLVVSPQVEGLLSASLADSLPRKLSHRFPGVQWLISAVREDSTTPPADALDLLEATRDRMLDEGWDIAVALTALPLKQGRHTYSRQVSAAHASGVISVPALGATGVATKTVDAVVDAVGIVLGLDPHDRQPPEAVAARARQLATDVEDVPDEAAPVFAARVVGGNLRVLAGMVRANRPWRLAAGLSKSLTVALAAGVLTLVTTDLWLLSAEYSGHQMVLLGLVSVAAVTGALVVGAGLWERPRRRAEREQVTLFNVATLLTVLTGVAVLHAAIFVASLAGAYLLVDADVFTGVTGEAATPIQYVKLSWLVAGLATIGGALGAGLEDDDAVRAAAYTRTD